LFYFLFFKDQTQDICKQENKLWKTTIIYLKGLISTQNNINRD